MAPNAREGRLFDLVVWGGAGFTGRLIVEYLCKAVRRDRLPISWAIAARSLEKAEEVRAWATSRAGALPEGLQHPAVLVGDARAQASVDRIVSEARVVVAAAGPFWTHGRSVVDACVRHGTDYVDISGETPWMRQLADEYEDRARAQGLRIVPACGFDSVPSDLGALFAATALAARTASPLVDTRCFVAMNGRLSGGTMATGLLMDTLGEDILRQRKDPYLLGGAPDSAAADGRDADLAAAAYDRDLQGWVAPFMMADINTRVVRCAPRRARRSPAPLLTPREPRLLSSAPPASADRRSIAILRGEGASPAMSPSAVYSEVAVAKDEGVARNMARGLPPPAKRQELMDRGRLPRPGEGPSESVREASWFSFTFLCRAEDGTTAVASVSGGDPGYTETAKMSAEAGLCLALEECRLRLPSGRAGVLTPATAFGGLLVERLAARGIAFRVEPNLPRPETMLRLPEGPGLASKL